MRMHQYHSGKIITAVMKDQIQVFFCVLALANAGTVRFQTRNDHEVHSDPKLAPKICAASNSDGVLVAHEHCNKFYQCWNGKPLARHCYGDLQYNPLPEICDWPQNVDCGGRLIPESNEGQEGQDSGKENESNNTGNDNPSEAPLICAVENSNGVLVAHEKCNQFYKCNHGKPVAFTCPSNLLYNPYTEHCDWPYNVECGGRTLPDSSENAGNGGDNEDSGNENTETGDSGSVDTGNSGTDIGESENGGSAICNCNPGEAPTLCAQENSDVTLIAHEKCNQYYQCHHGIPDVLTCPSGLLYNPYNKYCDWAYNVQCEDRPIYGEDSGEKGYTDNGDSRSESLENGSPENDGEVTEKGNSASDSTEDGTSDISESAENNNDDPSQAPEICAKDGSDGIIVANENCNQFYKCSNGKPSAQSCPNNLLYNPQIKQCDWPQNVECGNRLIPGSTEDKGDNDNSIVSESSSGELTVTTEQNPPQSESSSEETSTSNEESHSENESSSEEISATTEKNTPESESSSEEIVTTTEQNPPENVNSSEEILTTTQKNPQGNENSSEEILTTTEKNPPNNESSSEENSNGNSEERDVDFIDDKQALEYCQMRGAKFNFQPHQECNKFYACVGNEAVVLSCAGDLLYNSQTRRCELAEDVECGSRVVPENEDKAKEEKDTEENLSVESGENNDNIESEGNENTEAQDSGNESSDDDNNITDGNTDDQSNDNNNSNAIDDASVEDNKSNGSSENNGSGETDNGNAGVDSEVKEYCSLSGSNDKVLPHENCNQYYICIGGEPVIRTCSGQFLFNPSMGLCDWPQNVNCENQGAGGAAENGESGGNNGGDSENDGNSDQSEQQSSEDEAVTNESNAVATCSLSGSNNRVIPHDNCKQYYICVNGVPQVRSCSSQFLFNANALLCDWPQNVNCGDRAL